MGNQQCEECKQLKSQNAAYGEYQVCHYQGKQVALVEKRMEVEEGLSKKIQKQLKKRTNILSKHIVHLIRYEITQLEYEINIALYYEYMPKTLQELTEQMAFKGEDFTEKQLFNIIYGVEAGLQTLNTHGIAHGCVNLATILVKNNLFKITDISSTTYLTSYELVLQGNRQQFLSEKLLNNLNYKVIKPTDTDLNDDLFSLGLITLTLAAKTNPDHFYTWRKSEKLITGNFNTKHIEHCLRILNKNYSSKLNSKVKALLFPTQQYSTPTQEGTDSLIVELKDLEDDLNRVMQKINMKQSHPSTSKETSLRNSSRDASFY